MAKGVVISMVTPSPPRTYFPSQIPRCVEALLVTQGSLAGSTNTFSVQPLEVPPIHSSSGLPGLTQTRFYVVGITPDAHGNPNNSLGDHGVIMKGGGGL